MVILPYRRPSLGRLKIWVFGLNLKYGFFVNFLKLGFKCAVGMALKFSLEFGGFFLRFLCFQWVCWIFVDFIFFL